jgi:hypothetical protein
VIRGCNVTSARKPSNFRGETTRIETLRELTTRRRYTSQRQALKASSCPTRAYLCSKRLSKPLHPGSEGQLEGCALVCGAPSSAPAGTRSPNGFRKMKAVPSAYFQQSFQVAGRLKVYSKSVECHQRMSGWQDPRLGYVARCDSKTPVFSPRKEVKQALYHFSVLCSQFGSSTGNRRTRNRIGLCSRSALLDLR